MVCSNAHVLPSEHMSMTVLGWSKADHLLFLFLFGSSGTIIVTVNPTEISTTTTTISTTKTITEITS